MTVPPSRALTVAVLGTTQTLSWASSYYLPAILAAPIAAEFGISRAMVFGVFSGALLLTAVLGPAAGRQIDQRGGRDVLAVSNLVFAAGLVLMGLAPGPLVLCLAWAVLGGAMAMGLYDAAFATLAGLYGKEARNSITGITLIAGFASTVGWPSTALMEAEWGWCRMAASPACLCWNCASPTASGQAALFGFLGIEADRRAAAGTALLTRACVDQLTRLFGAEAAHPTATLLKDWTADEFTATTEDRRGGAHPLPQPGPWVNGAWREHLSLAGSETSASDPGYLAGALDAGTRAAEETLRRLDTPSDSKETA